MDARLLALRRQNEELRLELFWTAHSVQMLQSAMKKANTGYERSIRCRCWKCSLAGIMDGTVVDRNITCKFIPWLGAKINECGLIYEDMPPQHSHTTHMSDSSGCVCDVDSHFVDSAAMGVYMYKFTYGSKFWKAKTVDNPELKKLKKLFQLINVESTTDE